MPDHYTASNGCATPLEGKRGHPLLVATLLISFLLGTPTAATSLAAPSDAAGPQLAHPERSIRVGFWLDNMNCELMTPAVIDWLAQRASIVIYDGNIRPIHPYFSSEEVVSRFKAANPALQVLLYQWMQLTHDNSKIGALPYDELYRHPEWLVRTKEGKVVTTREGKRAWIDVTAPGYQAFLPRYSRGIVQRFGVDGIAYDNVKLRRLTFSVNKNQIEYDRLLAGYPEATIRLIQSVRSAIGPQRMVLFNGLWPTEDGQLEEQLRLLEVADAAQVEYFGYYPDKDYKGEELKTEFDKYVASIVDAMQAHPDKIITVFGRCRRDVYMDYEEEYRTARYCLASYLMGMTPRSTFKYNSWYGTSPTAQARTDAMDYLADYDLDIGRPKAPYSKQDGLYLRRFEKALVAMAPSGYGDRELALDRTYFSPEGKKVEGTLKLRQGEGAVLLYARPAEPPPRVVVDDFENGEPGAWRFPLQDDATGVAEDARNRYLCLRTPKNAFQPYHERILQPIRSLADCPRLKFRIRSSDPRAAVLLRVEVDDRSAGGKDRRPYAVLVLQPAGGQGGDQKTGPDIAYGNLSPPRHKVPYVAWPGPAWRADGRWHEVVIDVPRAFAQAAPQLKPWRIPSMRVLGDADLDDIVLERLESNQQ